MATGVLEIDSGAARLLVAEAIDGRPVPLLSRRTTRPVGRSLGRGEIVDLVAGEAAEACGAGATEVVVCAPQALRGTPGERALRLACARADTAPPLLLSAGERADLAFLGATTTVRRDLPSPLAVIDLSGDSTKIALGDTGTVPVWRGSRAVGAGRLNERALLSDPPSREQLAAARNAVGRRLMRLEPPPSRLALIAGSGSLIELVCGNRFDRTGIASALERFLRVGSTGLARQLEVDPALLRTLPAELIVLEALCDFVPEPFEVAPGGVLEGIALRAAEEPAATGQGR